MKKRIQLNESQLRELIRESISKELMMGKSKLNEGVKRLTTSDIEGFNDYLAQNIATLADKVYNDDDKFARGVFEVSYPIGDAILKGGFVAYIDLKDGKPIFNWVNDHDENWGDFSLERKEKGGYTTLLAEVNFDKEAIQKLLEKYWPVYNPEVAQESIVRRVTENVIRKLTEGMEEDEEQENISPIVEKIVVVLEEQANNFWDELIEKYGEDVSQWPLDYKDGYWQQTKDVDVNIAEDRKYGTWNGSVKFQLWIEPYFGYAPEDCSTYADYIDSNIYLEKDGQKIPYNGDGKLTPEDLSVVEDILEGKEDYHLCWLSIGHKPLWHPENNEPF